jgi:hypothetical protein
MGASASEMPFSSCRSRRRFEARATRRQHVNGLLDVIDREVRMVWVAGA